jgi:hypothetical protein
MSFLDRLTDERFTDQGSEGWDELRLGRFTASEIYRLMSEPRNKVDKDAGKLSDGAMTYVQIKVSEVLTGQGKIDKYAPAKEYGKDMEEKAIEYFMSLHPELSYVPAEFFPWGDHAGCSPDGWIGDEEGIEVKCPAETENHVSHLLLTDQWDLKRECPNYYWQVMSSLLFTEKKQWHFISYDPRVLVEKLKLQHLIIKPNKEDFELLTAKLAKAIKEKLSLIQLLQS